MLENDQVENNRYLTEDKYRMLVEQSPDGIAIYDRQGRFSEVNRRACEMLGYTPEELYRKRVPDVIAPEDLERQPLRLDDLRSGETAIDERVLLRKDGTRLPVELSVRLLTNGSFQVVVRDITARKKAEEEIRTLNASLEDRVRERTQELEDAIAKVRAEEAERERAEEALRITQGQLRRLVESNIIGILVGDFSGNALHANDALLDMLGYTREEFDSGALQWGNITPPEYADMGQEAIRQLRETGISGDYERVYRHKDGRLIHALVGAARLDETSNTAVAFIVDITERKKLEEQLRIREREVSTLIDNSPDIILRVDLNLRPTYVNRAMKELRGIDPENFAGTTSQDLGVPPTIYEPFEAACREVIKNGREITLEAHDLGRYFRSRIVPEFGLDGKVESIIAVIEDVTSRKKAEEGLAQSEERYRVLVEATSDVVWTTNADGEFVTPQSSWEAYTGQPWEEYRGSGWMEMVHPEGRAAMDAAWQEAKTNKTIYRSSGRIWNVATGEYRYYTTRAVPLRNPDGSVREWIGTLTDVHERMKAAREREQGLANEKLARREAEDAVHARDELLAIVSHDLKNPLTAIKGYAQLMRRRITQMEGKDSERLGQVIRHIDESSNKMNYLLNDLLDFGRLQAGQPLSLQRRPVNLVELARITASEFQRATSKHRFVIKAAEENIVGRLDSTRIEQTMANLLSNAVKYSPNGGTITIEVKREKREGKDEAVITVRDQGVGIDEAELPHIFEWYRRAKNVSVRISGAGIGLASAQYIVSQHGGTIEVASEKGIGSAFTIRLPV